jgi:hypothetical protein
LAGAFAAVVVVFAAGFFAAAVFAAAVLAAGALAAAVSVLPVAAFVAAVLVAAAFVAAAFVAAAFVAGFFTAAGFEAGAFVSVVSSALFFAEARVLDVVAVATRPPLSFELHFFSAIYRLMDAYTVKTRVKRGLFLDKK